MSEKGMQILHSRNLFPSLKHVDLEFVRIVSMENRRESDSSNVWGPTQVSSLSGSHYYVTFIDDATRKSWIYCIQNKSDVFDSFKKWKDLVENETGKRLKCPISDN